MASWGLSFHAGGADDRARRARLGAATRGRAALDEHLVAARAHRVLREYDRLPRDDIIGALALALRGAHDRMAIGDHVADQAERVAKHVADEVRHRHPEVLRAAAQLGLEALRHAGV